LGIVAEIFPLEGVEVFDWGLYKFTASAAIIWESRMLQRPPGRAPTCYEFKTVLLWKSPQQILKAFSISLIVIF